MKNRLLSLLLLAHLSLQFAAGQNITVFAAASLLNSFTSIGNEFESTFPNTKVVFNFAGSQELARQIVQGASADVFASADERQMDVAREQLVQPRQAFVRNRLVVVVPNDNPAALASFSDLSHDGVKIIMAAKEVPVGNYSMMFLDNAGRVLGAEYKPNVLRNVVSFEQNVRVVLTKVALGEADAGIVYVSDAMSAGAKVRMFSIPDSLNVTAKYPIAVLKSSRNAALARQFVDFVLSQRGQAILQKFGFIGVQ